MRALIARRPLLGALLLLVAVQGGGLVALLPLKVLVQDPSTHTTALAVMAGRCLCAIGIIGALGWWRQVGLTRPGEWRERRLLWFLLPLPLMPLLDGIAPGASARAGLYLVAALLVAVNEELLYRGLLLTALSPFGFARAAIGLAVLFSVIHLPNVITGANPQLEVARLVITAGGALALSAIRLRTRMLWAPIVVHWALDLSEYLAAGGIPALGEGRPFGTAAVVAVATYSAVLGALGLRWLRRLPGPVTGGKRSSSTDVDSVRTVTRSG